jgi:hypothetical protein
MKPPFQLAAQVSTSHSALETLSLKRIQKALGEAQAVMPLSILITGARDIPEIFNGLTGASRQVEQVYLWYNLLSDYPGQEALESVVNYQGRSGAGWSGWEEQGAQVSETFLFGCPNNPSVRQKTLSGLEDLLRRYAFDGVFLDKFRFPSPANGMEMVFSCFCPHCRQAAAAQGLDLERVRALLNEWSLGPEGQVGAILPPGASWLAAFAQDRPLLQHFLRFRADAVTALVREVRKLAGRLNKKIGLDLFSPAFAPLVGQDYTALAALADWGKPMTYRVAYGPAGLRLEAESLVQGLDKIYGVSEGAVLSWLERVCPEYYAAGYAEMIKTSVPLPWMALELEQATRFFKPRPVLMGLETVSFPGMIDMKPCAVQEMLAAGLQAGVQGAVLSWDLMNTPLENIQAIKDIL